MDGDKVERQEARIVDPHALKHRLSAFDLQKLLYTPKSIHRYFLLWPVTGLSKHRPKTGRLSRFEKLGHEGNEIVGSKDCSRLRSIFGGGTGFHGRLIHRVAPSLCRV